MHEKCCGYLETQRYGDGYYYVIPKGPSLGGCSDSLFRKLENPPPLDVGILILHNEFEIIIVEHNSLVE